MTYCGPGSGHPQGKLRNNMNCIPAEGLGYSFQETELFAQAKQRYDGSPAKELLLDWSHKNPMVSDLYRHLLANKLNLAADHLKEYGKSRRPLSVGRSIT